MLDTQITAVSTVRATLNASQNLLESTVQTINISKENLSAAPSRITDTEKASEMVDYTRSSILSQGGTATLTQTKPVQPERSFAPALGGATGVPCAAQHVSWTAAPKTHGFRDTEERRPWVFPGWAGRRFGRYCADRESCGCGDPPQNALKVKVPGT